MTVIKPQPLIQRSLLAVSLLLLPAVGWAQHPPLTGTMGTPSIASPAPTSSAPAVAEQENAAPTTVAVATPTAAGELGDSTRALLRMQAEGSHAGRALPMLGETASRSYQRYINSFEHPIPEFFEATLPSNKGQGTSP